ncbi:MAG: DUF1820 family protein [Gammaproteobacteria bacterium]|nr:MAG: DUF1820 family protein [Gammaproteobacteria bacterium]
MKRKNIYKVMFVNHGQVYEIYCKEVVQSGMMGFIEIEGMIFGEKSAIVIDPTEERLKSEFQDVKRTYIPFQSIIRIDEVKKEGVAKILPLEAGDNKAGNDNTLSFDVNKTTKD